MVIALIGNEGAGKDYLADILKGVYDINDDKVVSFAGPIHNLLMNMLGCDKHTLDKFKRRKNRWYDKYLNKLGLMRVRRETLMQIGNVLKEAYGEGIFVDRIKLDSSDITIVTDLRFMNEYESLKEDKLVVVDVLKTKLYGGIPKTKGYDLEKIILEAKKDELYYPYFNYIDMSSESDIEMLVTYINRKFTED